MKNCVIIFFLLFVGYSYGSVPELANFDTNERLKLCNVRVGQPAFSRWGDVYKLSYVAGMCKDLPLSSDTANLDSDILDFQHESIDSENNTVNIKVIHFESNFDKAMQKREKVNSNRKKTVPKLLDGHQTFPAKFLSGIFSFWCAGNDDSVFGAQLSVKDSTYVASSTKSDGLSKTVVFEPAVCQTPKRIKGYAFSKGFFWDVRTSHSYIPEKIIVSKDCWAGAESCVDTYDLTVYKKDIQNDSPAECVKIRDPHWGRIAGACAAVAVAATGMWAYAKR